MHKKQVIRIIVFEPYVVFIHCILLTKVFELIKDVTFDHEGDDPDIELTSYSEPDGVRLLAFDTLNEKDKDGNTHVDDGDTTLDNDISCSDEEQLLHASVRQP